MATTKIPPVDGWRATSPREVEKVERSSWANYLWIVCELFGCLSNMVTYVGCSKEPFALGAEFDCDAGEGGSRGWGGRRHFGVGSDWIGLRANCVMRGEVFWS